MSLAAESQLASTVLMIRPARFESNPLTATSNRFQGKLDLSPQEQQQAAATEFDEISRTLKDAGIRVIRIEDTAEPHTPDSIFPNNLSPLRFGVVYRKGAELSVTLNTFEFNASAPTPRFEPDTSFDQAIDVTRILEELGENGGEE